MTYKVIALYGGSIERGLELLYAQVDENGGNWTYELLRQTAIPYDPMMAGQLHQAHQLDAAAYLALHDAHGAWLGRQVNGFIEEHGLEHKVHLVVNRGYNPFQPPVIAELGHGAAIAAATQLPVVSELTILDGYLGGQEMPASAIAAKLGLDAEPAGPWKEALITALQGILRWREAYNMLHEATGASRSSIGGALWLGGEA